MGFIISGQATGSVTTTVPGDSNTQNTTLLLSGNGSNNATNNTFVDSSTNNFAVTRAGNTTQGTFSPYGDNWSNYFNGSSSLSAPSNAAFDFGTGDLTIECWIYVSSVSTSYQSVFQFGDAATTAGFHFLVNTNTICLRTSNSQPLTTSGTILVNTWNHIAITRASGTTKIFINGTTSGGTYNWTASLSSGTTRLIGSDTYSNPVTGYISNARVVKGTAVYTSNFTPSTTPLTAIANTSLLTCQSNRFIDNSTNNFAITRNGDTNVQRFSPFAPSAAYSTSTIGGSGYFDGTGDSLNIPSAAATGSGSFCFEAWIYPTNSSVQQMILANASNGGFFVGMNINGANKLGIGRTFVAVDNEVSYTWVNNQWYHITVNRNGTSLQFFVNGVQVGSTGSNSINYTLSGRQIGAETSGGSPFYGYISDTRFVNASVYTENFTPPSAPLTAIANTNLLLNYTNAGIIDNTMINNLETVGNAQISTAQSKFGGSSMAFDGTGDYLAVSPNVTNNLGTGDFTIEAWIYLTSASTYQFLIGSSNNVSGYMMVGLNVPVTGTQTIAIGRSGISWPVQFGNSITFSSNTWTHVAITRSGTTNKAFINGAQLGSVTDSTSWTFPSDTMWIGNQSGGTAFNGYIDDLRVTKGVARYTANFTPPTSALSAVGTVTTTTTGAIASGMAMSGTGTGMVISSYVAPPPPSTVEYLIVGGGGGAGNFFSGGGGAGGYRAGTTSVTAGTPYALTIGDGGAGITGGSFPGVIGNNGSNSSGFGITSIGGGAGGPTYTPGVAGGSGGGGGAGQVGGSGTSGQGNAGGTGRVQSGDSGGGGGGGAGAAGSSAISRKGGDGGIGIQNSITGTNTYYAGGGGGMTESGSGTQGVGGLGGGGNAYVSATPNTGGGGGGSQGSGGSGIVVVRYPDTYAAATATTGSPNITVANGYRVYNWTTVGSGSITF